MVGQNVKRTREHNDMSQTKLANILSVTRASVGNMENGRQNISLEILHKLSIAFNVPITCFFDGCENSSENHSQIS